MKNLFSRLRIKKPVINVDMEQIKVIPKGNVINITGLYPCFGVVLYNSNEKKACASHFPNPQKGTIDALMKKAVLELGNLNKVEAYCTGNAPLDDLNNLSSDYTQKTIRDREFVLSKLREYGLNASNIHFKWIPKMGFNASLKFDVDSGENEYIFYQNNLKIISKGNLKEVSN
jgi:hypothetical protein